MQMNRLLLAAAASLLLAGCASFSADGGLGPVSQLTRERTGFAPHASATESAGLAAQARMRELLAQPLEREAAVELALLANPGLQASLARVGIAEADRVQAGRLKNPSFRFGRLAGGGAVEIDRAVMFDLLGLLALPAASEAGRSALAQAQVAAARDAVQLAAEVRQAWTAAVASQQLADYEADVVEASEATGELARRMRKAGNFSALMQMREQAFHAGAVVQLARARQQAVADRERLLRLLGLPAALPAPRLPSRLPDLPAQPLARTDAEQAAMDQRLDVMLARLRTEATARALGLSRATRFINVLDLGAQDKRASGEPRATGYEVELQLPLFDFGSTRVARAQFAYMASLQETAQVANLARSEVRESQAAYRSAWELARHYRDEIVPLRKRIADENLLRYNGMLISVFELVADAREQVAAVSAALAAQRDFWLADARLQAALTAGSPRAAAQAD